MNKAVFLDRDGTINVEKHYLYRTEDFEFLAGAIEGMRLLQDAGYQLVIVTNQSGIARGYYTEDEFTVLNSWMMTELEKHGVGIDAVYYCPHLPDAKIEKYRIVCNCRKPRLGLYERAIKELDIDMNCSWAIGDKLRDCSICERSGCKGFVVGKNEDAELIERVKNGGYRNIDYALNLYDAAKMIVEDER